MSRNGARAILTMVMTPAGARTGLVLILAAILMSCSGQSTPQIVDTLGATSNDPSIAQRVAPIVIVATVTDNVVVERDRTSARIPGVLLDLHSVRCRLENVIRGGPLGEKLSFYYFVESDASRTHNPYYKSLFKAVPGGRYVFFLVYDNGRMRSVGDVGEYSIAVFTGSHQSESLDKDFGRAIADVVLRKGASINESQLMPNLEKSSRIADQLGSRLYNMQLLKQLAERRGPLRSEACRVLMRRYYSQYGCLLDIIHDPTESAENRLWARTWLSDAQALDKRTIETLANPDRLDLSMMAVPVNRTRQLEELKTILSSPSGNVRRAACMAIHRNFPDEPLRCP